MARASTELGDYPRPSLAVDSAVLSVAGRELKALLWKRAYSPHEGQWALPGVFVNPQESLEGAVARGLRTKTHLSPPLEPEQIMTWNRPGRDPRGWVVSVAYLVLVPPLAIEASTSGFADVATFTVEAPPDRARVAAGVAPIRLVDGRGDAVIPAFDHDEILDVVLRHLRRRIWTSDLALQLVPKLFTLRDLQTTFEAIEGRTLNKDSFRRRVTQTMELVTPSKHMETGVGHRPARLYQRARSRRHLG